MLEDNRCPECGARMTAEQTAEGSCPACMLELGLDQSHTRSAGLGPNTTPAPYDVRFLPGVIVGDRYRIVSLLGRGGMGEVYRADDLKLGQPVALKFLPEALISSARIKAMLNEVKLARQVSHPNVCRVYDVGEIEGVHFLSMEYVDGEDLATLLHRIDHVPRDRAIRIARQLCAGLAAAHEQGILHRDLKPANVMIDSRGRAKITDFGLAEIEHGGGGGPIAGTPCYMAPEQAARGEVSQRSDIYSLGLVLYELFTGTRVFDASTPAEMQRLQQNSAPPTPSSQMDGFDPEVERIILHCLEVDPTMRPPSALAVAAGLPGGDALAAALAAGETPAPEVVAAAGGEGTLRPVIALACLVAALIGVALTTWSAGRSTILGRSDLQYPPQVMAAKAREVVQELGYVKDPADEAWLFYTNFDYLNHIHDTDTSMTRWDRLRSDRPTPMGFWYRSSPRFLVPLASRQHVEWHDPPRGRPGMINLRLDSEARLLFLSAVPDRHDVGGEKRGSVDWTVVFDTAGLEVDAFTAVESEWTPVTFCNERRAWLGGYPGQTESGIRVEACATGGRLTYFEIIHPWTRDSSAGVSTTSAAALTVQVMFQGLAMFLLVTAALMARRNLRSGRGDRRSAFRIAAFVVVTSFVGWLLASHHVPQLSSELWHSIQSFAFSLFLGFVVWVMYIALEPFVRRVWPELLISWSRLMSGKFNDPIVGRHLLFGALFGFLSDATLRISETLTARLGYPPDIPDSVFTEWLQSVRWLVGSIIGGLGEDVLTFPLLLLFLLVFARFVLRRKLLALAVLTLLFVLFKMPDADHWAVTMPFLILAGSLHAATYARFGLVGAIAAGLTSGMSSAFPLTADSSTWYFSISLLCLLLPVGLIVYAFWISLGGRPLIGEEA